MYEVLRMRTLEFIAVFLVEALMISSVQVKMRAFKFLVLAGICYNYRFSLAELETLLVDRRFGEIGFDYMQFAEVAPAATLLTHTAFSFVVLEIGTLQFAGRTSEVLLSELLMAY